MEARLVRLIDIVMQSPKTQTCSVGGVSREMPAAGSLSSAIGACTLRYVLDRSASAEVSRQVFAPSGPIAHPDELTRLPSRPFWLECYPDNEIDPDTGERVPGRMGFYVEPIEEGNGGTISCVAETRFGEACILAADVEFDLSGQSLPRISDRCHRMRHAENADIDHLLGHARLVVGLDWMRLARNASDQYQEFLRWQADRAWVAVPLVLSFAALLNARTAFVQRPSELARLNLARARAGRPELLDHIELGLNLSAPESRTSRGHGRGDARNAPRLHFVRGHDVTRAGRTFWRTAHFRGDGISEPTRTFRVTARRSS